MYLVEGQIEAIDVEATRIESDPLEYYTLKAEIADTAKVIADGITTLGRLLQRMRDKKLYEAEFDSWEKFCTSIQLVGFNRLSHIRANQIIRASQTQQYLLESLSEVYSERVLGLNENTIRHLRQYPEAEQPTIMQTVFDESETTGRESNSRLVQQVAGDRDITLESIVSRFGHLGDFKPYQSNNRKTQKYRFSFETSGKSSLFETLTEAQDWLTIFENSATIPPSCFNCANCEYDERANSDEIICSLKDYVVNHERVDLMPEICGTWRSQMEASVMTIEAPPTPTPAPKPKFYATGAGVKGGAADQDEWYTPEYIWRPGLELFGIDEYDLDPTTCDESPVPAKLRYTIRDDARRKKWIADVLFANFPFSLNKDLSLKFIEEYLSGNVKKGILFLKTDHTTVWYKTLVYHCDSYCLCSNRVKYVGAPNCATFGSTIFNFGGDPLGFFKKFQDIGIINQSMARLLPAKDLIPQKPTEWTGITIRNIWRKIGNVSERQKYNSGFLVDNNKLDIHYEFQTQMEAWSAWIRDEEMLLELIR